MEFGEPFAAMARNNAWSNRRLHAACSLLTQAEFEERRTSYFPTIQATLNHILRVDRYYLAGLEGAGHSGEERADPIPFPRMAELALAQREADQRLIRFCESLDPDGWAREVILDRGDEGLTRESVGAILAHLFVHQIHHRGQAHAMLAGTRIAPPQLDEFFLEYDRPRRLHESA